MLHSRTSSCATIFVVACAILFIFPSQAAAFGAGNVPSVSQVEGSNWRHGDIEDMLSTVAFLNGRKWTSAMIKRVYFGNWLRDYSQAVDVGSLKGVNKDTIRILVWILSFLSFGYATAEFEVTEERLGVYRPEEHIDNPKGYADDLDARKYDARLRGPVDPKELQVDPRSGMKNYIANENGNWATSTGYIKFSLQRSIHFGRVYTNGAQGRGKEEDLCEALRCLGQALHCLEDFGAHTNYVELALIELGYGNVFPHCGMESRINLNGHHVFPLVTGTFGAVDFLHSVLGELGDHTAQMEVNESEVEQLGLSLKMAQEEGSGSTGARSLDSFTALLGQIPGAGTDLAEQARDLQAQSEQESYDAAMAQSREETAGSRIGVADIDPVATVKKIYPILVFRDRIVRAINNTIARIPGLETLVEKISERLTLFVMGLLAPYITPVIEAVANGAVQGSGGVVNASADQQFGPWNDARCTDPTHSMLSKDHFSNRLNGCAGRVAATMLQYAVPRILYAWQNTGVAVAEVADDILRAFHHPANRHESVEIQRNMFNTVRTWADEQPDRHSLDAILSSASVRAGQNHRKLNSASGHSHNAFGGTGLSVNKVWQEITRRDLREMQDRGLDADPVPPNGENATEAYGYGGRVQQTQADYRYSAPDPPFNPGPAYDFNPDYTNNDPHAGQQQWSDQPTSYGQAPSYGPALQQYSYPQSFPQQNYPPPQPP